jgi:hypothetical protein
VTASATFHHPSGNGDVWASTLAWGRNTAFGESTQLVLYETTLALGERHAWFGRAEIGGKSAHELEVHGDDEIFTIAKLQGGYTRYLVQKKGLQPGIGAHFSVGFVPAALESTYSGRANVGAGIFITLRPASHQE